MQMVLSEGVVLVFGVSLGGECRERDVSEVMVMRPEESGFNITEANAMNETRQVERCASYEYR